MHGRARANLDSKPLLPGGIDSATAATILSCVRDVVIIVSRDRQLQFANPAAQHLLARRNLLHLRAGRVTGASSARSVALERAIDCVCSAGDRDEIIVLRGTSAPPLVLTVKCLRHSGSDTILLVGIDGSVEPSRVQPSLRRCFGLTASEAEVAGAIAAGHPSASIAAARGVRLNTIRSQIKSIAAKLGCATQSQISAIVRATPLSVDAPN